MDFRRNMVVCFSLLCACGHQVSETPKTALAHRQESTPRGLFDVTAAPFSARGDGVTDDGPAIQRAISAAVAAARDGSGAVVHIPAGSYRIARQLELVDESGAPAAGLVIRGDGDASRLAFDLATTGHGIAVLGRGARDLVIRDLRIDAARSGGGFNRGIALHGGQRVVLRDLDISGARRFGVGGKASGFPAGIFLSGGISDVRLIDNHLHDNGSDDGNSWHIVAYGTNAASQLLIRGNRCINTLGAVHRANFGIGIFNSTYVAIEGNTVEGMTGTRRDADGYGIMLYGSSVGQSHHHRVTGNTVRRSDGAGIYVQASPYTLVNGNLLEDTARTQSSTSLAIGAIGVNLGPGVISNNVIRGVGTGNAAPAPPFGIAIQTCRHGAACALDDGTPRGIAVTGNTIEQTAGYGIAIEAGPAMAADNSTIIGNTLVNTRGGIGTVGDQPLSGLVIVGNSIVRGPSPTTDSAPGIILGAVTGSVITDNSIIGAKGQGIVLHVGARRNVVAGNVVRDSSSVVPGHPGIQISGVGNLITGNQSYNSAGAGQSWGVSESGTGNHVLFNNVAGNSKADGIHTTGTHTLRGWNRTAAEASDGEAAPVKPKLIGGAKGE